MKYNFVSHNRNYAGKTKSNKGRIKVRLQHVLKQKASSAYYESKSYYRDLTKEQKRKINCCLNCKKDSSQCNGDCELMKMKRS